MTPTPDPPDVDTVDNEAVGDSPDDPAEAYHDEPVETAVREAVSVVPDGQNVSGRDHITETAVALFGLGKVTLYAAGGDATPSWAYNVGGQVWLVEAPWSEPASDPEQVTPEDLNAILSAHPTVVAIPSEASPFTDRDLGAPDE
jgi:hypothetical protein